MANDIPEISRGARTPITSAGGSGGAGLGGINYETSTTPDMTGVGAALGALGGALLASRGSGAGTGGAGSRGGGGSAIERAQNAVEELSKVIPVFDSQGNQVGTTIENTPFEPPGGYPSREGNVYPEGIASVVKELVRLPPDVPNYMAQDYINEIFGTVNGQPRYIASGIADFNTNTIVALPNYNIGPDFSKFERGRSDDYTGGGYDPTQDLMPSIDEGVQTFPYDFSNELTSDQMTNLMGDTSPTIDISGFDPSELFAGDFLDSFTPSFDTGSLFAGIGDTFSDIGSSVGDLFDFDFGSLFAKDGGHIKGYATGGRSIGTTLTGAGIGGGLGALLGALLSGQSTGQVSRGVDMSKVGVINPRTTTFGVGPARFAPYSQYTTSAPAMPFDYSKLMKNLGMGMADGGSASYYTFGTPVNPSDVMKGSGMPVPAMKSGGLPKATAPMTMEGRHDYRHGQYVDGVGDGQSDDIPAMLADGEYVIDSDTVAALGNGSNKAGAKLLDGMRKQIRAHKRSAPVDKIPPKAKSPLEYMRMGAMKKGAK